MRTHHIVSVPLDSISTRVRVIVHGFIHKHSQVHGHGVPTSVLEVDEHELGVVLNGHENIVLMSIVMGQHIWKGSFRNQAGKKFVVSLEQECLLEKL